METKEYFEKVMQDFRSAMPLGSSKNQHRNGRSLRKYCQDEGIDYKWLQEYKRTYPNETKPVQESKPEPQSFIPLVIEEEKTQPKSVWQVSHLRLESPDGGFIDINSNFRHILKTRYAHISEQVRAAMGRRCWLNSGSHDAAQNIAFMYSLYESCKMNDIDFGEYVEDILTRMMNGDDDYRSMIPCYYTPGKKQEKKVA